MKETWDKGMQAFLLETQKQAKLILVLEIRIGKGSVFQSK